MFNELSPFRSALFAPLATPSAASRVAQSQRLAGSCVAATPASDELNSIESPRSRRAGEWLGGTVLVVAIGLVTAVPWLEPKLVWCGWLGAAAALWLSSMAGKWRLLSAWAWALIAICLAFHWAPATLTYTMHSSYWLGFLVAMCFAAWESFRAMLPFWLAGKLTQDLRRVWFAAALLTVVVETLTPSVLPWKFGYTQTEWPWLVQSVDLFGAEWASLIYFAHAGLILLLFIVARDILEERRFSRRSFRPALRRLVGAPVVWLCAANLIYGASAATYWRSLAADSPALRVALVQVDPSYNDSVKQMRTLTEQVADRVDLVCWPESSGGSYDLALDRLSDERQIFALSRDPNRGLRPWENPQTPLLLGAKTYNGHRERPKQLYQSAMLLDNSERIVGRYHKRDLMPFGEYVPGEGWAPGIKWLFSIDHPVTRGTQATVLSLGNEHPPRRPNDDQPRQPMDGAKLGVMLCYEDMLPETSRSLVDHSANLLVSLINGAAFSSPLTLQQHRRLAQLRAVECRRYFLRCAATGETCVISPLGEIEARLPLNEPGVLVADAHLLDAQTWYVRLGRLFPVACCLELAIWLAPGTVRWLRSRQKMLGNKTSADGSTTG